MSDDHIAHLNKIVNEFTQLASVKYVTGQKEHGGNLWEKEGLLDMAIDEAIDQVIYLLTLKKQLKNDKVV